MSKKDLVIVVALVLLWIAWPTIDRTVIRPLFPEPPEPIATEEVAPVEGAAGVGDTELGVPPAAMDEAIPEVVPDEPEPIEQELPPEETVVLENEHIAVTISSHGAAIKSATLKEYPQSMEDEGDVILDFASMPALAYDGLPGFGAESAYSLTEEEDGKVVLHRAIASGLSIKRSYSLSGDYVLSVADELVNDADEPIEVAGFWTQLGAMRDAGGGPAMRGMVSLGADTLSPGGEKVQHWGKRLKKLFADERDDRDAAKLPVKISRPPHENAVEWIAAKNKYFVQILTPEGGGEACRVYAERELDPREEEDARFKAKMTPVKEVSCLVGFDAVSLEPDQKFLREMTYYVGPKKYSALVDQGFDQVGVMELGFFSPIGKLLLRGLNFIYAKVWPHSYGLAIIIITFIIRIVFWPVTHKSTESMKRMSEIQPLANEVREKYKDNPQRQQQEIMALYKEHKVNPFGGCLPMLIQIPVFIALFGVLRSAIELRFSPFLWIADLSQPENLLAGVLPIPLNILPLVMSGTMFWQQKLNPGAGDSQQQKMMAFMPVMMLVFFYKMPSGLVLYWTTNQCLMIVQQLLLKRKRDQKAAAEA